MTTLQTPKQRAEAQARAFCLKHLCQQNPVLWERAGHCQAEVAELTTLLLATEAACLEEVAVQVVEQEEELDGAMPDELFTAITGGHRALVEETLRCVVRATKKHIMARLRKQAAQRSAG